MEKPKTPPKPYRNMKARLDANSVINNNGCWLWVSYCNTNGYGRINVRKNGKIVKLLAHRVAFEEYVRILETGEEIDHNWGVCNNRNCINPEHLRAVDKQTNLHYRNEANGYEAKNIFVGTESIGLYNFFEAVDELYKI